MVNNSLIGSTGEKVACGYLGGKGYKILETNFRTRFGEIDIISKYVDKTLVFTEVKTSVKRRFPENTVPESYPHFSTIILCSMQPEDRLSTSKIQKFKKIAEFYANNHPLLVPVGYRLDALCIDLSPNLKTLDIRHYEGILT